MTPTSLTPDELALLLEVDGGAPVSAEARALHAIGHAIREATSGGVDVADDVMLSLALQSATSGGVDVADDVMLSLALQSATGGGVDVADDVMLSLALQSATGGGVDVANDVMAEVRPLRTAPTMPQWASLGGMGALFAMAAAALFFIQASSVGMVPPVELHAEAHLPRLTLASFNDAEVEDISAPDSAAVSVMQFSEGGPTIIFVQESEG